MTSPLSVQQINATWNSSAPVGVGLVPVLTTACNTGGSDTFTNDGRTFIYVLNGASGPGTPLTVTVVNEDICDHGFDHDIVADVNQNTGLMLGPFPVQWFTSTATITYSGSLTGSPKIAVFQLPTVSPGGS